MVKYHLRCTTKEKAQLPDSVIVLISRTIYVVLSTSDAHALDF